METTETEHQEPPHEHDMVLSQEAQYYLQQAGKWASFIAIMGFIGCGLLVIVALFAGTVLSYMTRFSPNPGLAAAAGPVLGIVYFLLALVVFFINYNLYMFASKIKRGIAFISNDEVTLAMSKLRSFFKLKGIILIVVIGLYALSIISVVAAAVIMHR